LTSEIRKPLLYYITDRSAFPGDESSRRERLLEKIAEAASCGVDFIQLREKDLGIRELEKLAADSVRIVRQASSRARLLINSRVDVAIAVGADGVHLRSDDISPNLAKRLLPQASTLAVSCHRVEEVYAAVGHANFVVYGPVFGKKDLPGAPAAGLGDLREACRLQVPVVALGGVTLENAAACMQAGAAGIAAIRLFQENDIGAVIKALANSTADLFPSTSLGARGDTRSR
jgi:thiamine-phosphate pyrophosphorylase